MTPKAIVNAIEIRLGVTGAPLQLRDAIEQELLDIGFQEAAAAEHVDRVRKKVLYELTRRRDERDEMGEIAVLHVRGSNDEIVHGSSYVFSDDPEHIQESKLNRISVDEIYRHVRKMSFSQFETFGRCVIREIGCDDAKVTPHAGDQGIDFYGSISIGGLLGADLAILKLMHETKMILVGQAKHYPTTVIGPAIVRELVGALSLSRTYTYSKDSLDLLGDVKLRPFSPVLALLFSTGDFTKGARHLAKRAGLIAFSGWQLSVFLADKGVGLIADHGTRKFDAAVFDEWLSR
jgi:hypothetical protein